MVTRQGCPQTPGGRIRALGFARMGARGRRRSPRLARPPSPFPEAQPNNIAVEARNRFALILRRESDKH